MNPNKILAVALWALLLGVPGPLLALSTDRDQPVEIQADFAEMDDQAGTTTYIGNVVVVQGSIRMTGDRVVAEFDENRALKDVFVKGRPAYFKQTPDGGKEDIEGQALEVEYHATKNQLVLIKEARLNQGGRSFEGYRINYDTKRSVMIGRGGPQDDGTEGAGAAKQGGRIKVIIPPKPKAGAPADAPAEEDAAGKPEPKAKTAPAGKEDAPKPGRKAEADTP